MNCDYRNKVCTARMKEGDEIVYLHHFHTDITVRAFASLQMYTNENPNHYSLSIPIRPLTLKMIPAHRILPVVHLLSVSWVTEDYDHIFTLQSQP